ncbi:hypothetical protein [Tenacibaculum bernardetii]|uniref:hypothetical protein n=1 Tax=Tenacibaculum bernardetii TaxID=3021375 RepID=UPI0023B1B163|nr:hypothetical protein [Tenacibaculum bernardetii]
MKHLIDLNKEIEKIVNPEINFHHDYQTFSFFKTWVVEADNEYFNNWEKRIKDKINHIADLDSPIKVKFIKVFHQDVLQKYKDLLKLNFNNLDTVKSTIHSEYKTSKSIDKPKKRCSDISYEKESVFYMSHYYYYEEIIYKLGKIFYSDNYLLLEDPEYTLEDEKSNLEELILESLEVENEEIEKKVLEAKEANRAFLEKEGTKKEVIEKELSKIHSVTKVDIEEELEKVYSYVHLSICLDNTKTVLKNIIKHLDNLVNLIKKLENYKEDEFTLDEILINDPTDIKLEYKLSKMEVALFYRALHDTGIIHVNNQGQKHPYTNLKSYIDNSNIYYLDKAKMSKVNDITRQFARFLNDNKYEKHELKMLNHIIEKFKSRIEYIKANQEEGLA